MISSLIIALRNALTLKEGVARHLAVATMQAVKGPETPMLVTSSARFGVSLNGTGRFPSSSPGIANLSHWLSMHAGTCSLTLIHKFWSTSHQKHISDQDLFITIITYLVSCEVSYSILIHIFLYSLLQSLTDFLTHTFNQSYTINHVHSINHAYLSIKHYQSCI